MESNKNVEVVLEVIQGDLNSFQKLMLIVLDFISDENEMEIFGGIQFNEYKFCFFEIYNIYMFVMGYFLFNQFFVLVNVFSQLL